MYWNNIYLQFIGVIVLTVTVNYIYNVYLLYSVLILGHFILIINRLLCELIDLTYAYYNNL